MFTIMIRNRDPFHPPPTSITFNNPQNAAKVFIKPIFIIKALLLEEASLGGPSYMRFQRGLASCHFDLFTNPSLSRPKTDSAQIVSSCP